VPKSISGTPEDEKGRALERAWQFESRRASNQSCPMPTPNMRIKDHKKNSTSYITLIFCVTGILAVAVGNLLWTLFVSLAG
jgi:hypothetical protein